jgi:hypothetical protein
MKRKTPPSSTVHVPYTPLAPCSAVHPADLRMAGCPAGAASPGFRHVFTDVDNTLAIYGTQKAFPGAIRFLHELRGDMDEFGVSYLAPKINILSARPGQAIFDPDLGAASPFIFLLCIKMHGYISEIFTSSIVRVSLIYSTFFCTLLICDTN